MDYDFGGRLIAVVGKARSGKDTVAQMIAEEYGHTRLLAFAEPLKRFAGEVYDFSEAQLYGALKETPDERYPRLHDYQDPTGTGAMACARCGATYDVTSRTCSYLTPREALQKLGTEWGRACWPDTWVNYAFRQAAELLGTVRIKRMTADVTGIGASSKENSIVDRCHFVVITDCRFVNEAAAVRAVGGRIWRVNRDGAGLDAAASQHASEREQHSPEMDGLVEVDIYNHGTLEALRRKVKAALAIL